MDRAVRARAPEACPDVTPIKDGAGIDLGRCTIDVIATPGHAGHREPVEHDATSHIDAALDEVHSGRIPRSHD